MNVWVKCCCGARKGQCKFSLFAICLVLVYTIFFIYTTSRFYINWSKTFWRWCNIVSWNKISQANGALPFSMAAGLIWPYSQGEKNYGNRNFTKFQVRTAFRYLWARPYVYLTVDWYQKAEVPNTNTPLAKNLTQLTRQNCYSVYSLKIGFSFQLLSEFTDRSICAVKRPLKTTTASCWNAKPAAVYSKANFEGRRPPASRTTLLIARAGGSSVLRFILL